MLMNASGTETRKYVPIVRCAEVETSTPNFLKTAYCIHWPENCSAQEESGHRETLIRELFDVVPEAPPIGPPPVFIRKAMRGRQ